LGSEARLGPQFATSLAALLIALRSETLCVSIPATLVAACSSVPAVADGEGVPGDARPDDPGLADVEPPPPAGDSVLAALLAAG
jgi:hypothetical protein